MNINEVRKAIELWKNEVRLDKKTLVWNDPDPIEGNDYTVIKTHHLDEEMASISYGTKGDLYLSEAKIPIGEFGIK